MKKTCSKIINRLSKDETGFVATATIAGAGTLCYFGFAPVLLKHVASGLITTIYSERSFPVILANYWFMNKVKTHRTKNSSPLNRFISKLICPERLETEMISLEQIRTYRKTPPKTLTATKFAKLFPNAYKNLVEMSDNKTINDENILKWLSSYLKSYKESIKEDRSPNGEFFFGLDGINRGETVASVDYGLHTFLEIWAFKEIAKDRWGPDREERDFSNRVAMARNYHRTLRGCIHKIGSLDLVGKWSRTEWEETLDTLSRLAAHMRGLKHLINRKPTNQGVVLMAEEAKHYRDRVEEAISANHYALIGEARDKISNGTAEERALTLVRLDEHISFLEKLDAHLSKEFSFSDEEEKHQELSKKKKAVASMLNEANTLKNFQLKKE